MELTPKGRAALERGRPHRAAVPGSLDFEERCLERFDAKQNSRAPLSLIEGLFRFKTGLDPERQRRLYCDLPLCDSGMVDRARKMVEKDLRTHRTTRAVKELRDDIAREMREWRVAEKAKAAAAVCLLLFASACSSPPCGKGSSLSSHAPSTATNPPSRGAGLTTAPSPSASGATATRDSTSPRGGTSGAPTCGAPILISVHSVEGLSYRGWPRDGQFSPDRIDITARLENDPARCRAVCAHEIGHALGTGSNADHTSVPNTWMCDGGTDAPPCLWPTDAEIAAAVRWSGSKTFTLVLTGLPPVTARSTRWAAATWNAALGRDAVRCAP